MDYEEKMKKIITDAISDEDLLQKYSIKELREAKKFTKRVTGTIKSTEYKILKTEIDKRNNYKNWKIEIILIVLTLIVSAIGLFGPIQNWFKK